MSAISVTLSSRQFAMNMPDAGLSVASLEASRAPEVVAGNAVIQTIGTLIFLARIYSRFMINDSWKLDDHVLVGAWFFASAYSFCQYNQVHHGAGRHIAVITAEDPNQVMEVQKYAFAALLVALFALALPKLSICITYLRIFRTDTLGKRLIQGIMTIILIPSTVFVFLMIFQCKPVEAFWKEGRPADKCSQDISGLYIIGSINVFVDLALQAVVLPRILDLQMNLRQKWVLVSIVCLGSFAALAGLIRMIRVGIVLTDPHFDPTWDAYDISIWTSTEVYVSLICASAPGAKPLVAQIMPKLLGSSMSTRGRSHYESTVPSSAGMSFKLKRGTLGSNGMRTTRKQDTFAEEQGPCEQISGGFDKLSLDEKKCRNETGVAFTDPFKGGIVKTQEITIRSSLIGIAR